MAAVAEVQLVNISINDIPLQVPKGELVIESVKRLGLEVPIFCYHPRMKPVGMCRMCLIECGFKQPDGSVRKMPKPQTACTLPASEGLVVYTDTDLIHNDRRGVLEFLLINHPLDCPICDRGGECPLQNNTLFYGPSTSRFVEMKRHAPKAFPLSKYVTLDLERCIQCGRCVRFTEEISGDGQLAFRFRGARMQPSTFEMTDFDSKFSGNVIEICPVGALTSSKYRFRARPWDIQTGAGICTLCSNGCNVYLDYRRGEVARMQARTNEGVNEEWTCDRGKFGHYIFNTDKRLGTPLVRRADKLTSAEWTDAYGDIAGPLKAAGKDAACLASGTLSNEDLFMARRLFREELGSDHLDHRFTRSLSGNSLAGPKTPIADIENAATILVFGTSLADDEPIVFLRVRKAWFKNGARVVVAHSTPTDVDSFAHTILRYRPGTQAALARALVGSGDASETGVSAQALAQAREVLGGSNSLVISSASLFNESGADEALEALKNLGGTTNVYALRANDQGAAELQIQPQRGGKHTHQVLESCAAGEVKFLWLAGCDPFAEHYDKELVRRALENVEFLVVQHWAETEAMPYASVVLPMTAPAESDGSFTSAERRVQRMRRVLGPVGSAKPAWRVFEELALRLRPKTPLFGAKEIFDRIATEVPAYSGLKFDGLGDEGTLLQG